MARARCAGVTVTHQADQVIVLDFASIQVTYAGTTNPIIETIFAADTGTGTKPNPFQSDADGNFAFYLDVENTVRLTITHPDAGVLIADFVPVTAPPGSFVYIPGIPGTPSVTPPSGVSSGRYPLEIDVPGRRLYFHNGSIWSRFYDPMPTIFVAASDASADAKSVAGPTFTCSGTNDNTVIQAALNAIPTVGGTVILSEGTFNVTDTMVTSRNGTILTGQGSGATRISATSSMVNTPVLQLNTTNCILKDLAINCNRSINGGKSVMRALVVNGTDCVIDRVAVLNSPSNGCDITGARTRVINSDFVNHQFVAFNIGGAQCTIQGCRVTANLSEGIYTTSDSTVIIGNSSISNGGSGITTVAPSKDCLIIGNLCRNNTGYGINNSGGTNNYIGANDTYNNTAGGINNTGTNTRRVIDQILNYNLSADLGTPPGAAVPIPANTPTTIGTPQNFVVLQSTSLVRIDVRGFVMVGNNGINGSEFGSRLLIDGSPVAQLGGGGLTVGSLYLNALHGAGAFSILGLAAAPTIHTVAVQVFCAQASNMFCRPVSVPGVESFGIQITEHAR